MKKSDGKIFYDMTNDWVSALWDYQKFMQSTLDFIVQEKLMDKFMKFVEKKRGA